MSTPSIAFAEIYAMKKLQEKKMMQKMEEKAGGGGGGRQIYTHGNHQVKTTSGGCFFTMFKKIHPSHDVLSVSEIPRN